MERKGQDEGEKGLGIGGTCSKGLGREIDAPVNMHVISSYKNR